jgi:hypothetical protein
MQKNRMINILFVSNLYFFNKNSIQRRFAVFELRFLNQNSLKNKYFIKIIKIV